MADDISAPGSSGSAAPSSSAPNTADSSSVAATPASATPTPTGGAAPDSASTGAPPPERWDAILDNARKKTRAEVEGEYRSKYGWADEFQSQPLPYLEQWLDQLSGHPEHGPKLLAKAARMLAARRGQVPQALDEPQPDVPIADAHGNPTGEMTYSAKQQQKREAWFKAQLEAGFAERLAPFESFKSRQEQAEHKAELARQSDEQARSLLTTMRANPYFKEHEAKVKQAFMDHPEFGDNLHAAFTHVLTTEILPTLSQTEQRKVVESLQQKAHGGSVSAGTQTATQKPRFKSFGDATRYYHEHPEEAEASLK